MLYCPKTINFTPTAAAQGGPGVSKAVTWYVNTPYIDITPANYPGISAGVGLSLGDFWWLNGVQSADEGNAFMFVKTNANLTLGQLVAADLPQTGTWTAAGSSTALGITNITPLNTTTNGEVDNWIYVDATGATLPQFRRIKANTAGANAQFRVSLPDYLRPSSPNDQDVFDTLPTNGNNVSIIRPFNVRVCTAALPPIGVALGTVTSGDYTIIQVAGLAAVSAIGTTTPTVAGQPAVPAAAGQIAGSAGSAANLFVGGVSIIPQYATAAAANIIPCFVNFIGS